MSFNSRPCENFIQKYEEGLQNNGLKDPPVTVKLISCEMLNNVKLLAELMSSQFRLCLFF